MFGSISRVVSSVMTIVGSFWFGGMLWAQAGGDVASVVVATPGEVQAGGEVGLVFMFTNIIKGLLPKSNWANKALPIIAILVAVGIGLLTSSEGVFAGVKKGFVLGLATTGFYRTGTVWKENKSKK